MKKKLTLLLCLALALVLSACSKIELDTATLDLKLGETGQLTPDTKDTPVTYESSDTAVVTVDENGKITTVGVGSATVTATNSKGKTAECAVNVSHVEPTGISFKTDSFNLEPGKTAALDVAFEPKNTTNFAITYSSDNEAVATVDADGTITAVSAGSATITATTENGQTATCAVTVPPYASSITMDATLDLVVKDSATLSPVLSPDGCVNEAITWTSSDESIATVSNGKVTAVAPGTATITATTDISGCTAECVVTVDYAELQVTVDSGGYSSSSMASINGHAVFSKTIGFKPKATATGGSGDYQYKFVIIKGGSTIYNSGWQKSSTGAEKTVSSGGSFIVRVTVQDSRGVTATAEESVTLS